MHDLKLKKIPVSEASYPLESSPSMYPPSFHVTQDQMPEVKGWKVGGKYKLMVEIEQTSKYDSKQSTSGDFNIIAYKHLAEKDVKDMNDEEFEHYSSKVRSTGKL